MFISFAWLIITGTGCGQDFTGALATRSFMVTQCGNEQQADQIATDLILLQWDGGTTPLYPDQWFAPMDLSLFETQQGGTLFDRAEAFREEVLRQVTRIYCDHPDIHIRVEHTDAVPPVEATLVYFVQEESPEAVGLIGEAHYDPCNQHQEDTAVLFAEQIRRLGHSFTFDDWVMIFANTAAHEIAHTLGFAHVEREDQPDPQRFLYLELMLDRHTIDELLLEQRFVVDLTACPEEYRRLRIVAEPTIQCGMENSIRSE